MLSEQDDFIDAFIVDFYSTRDEGLKIKPCIGCLIYLWLI